MSLRNIVDAALKNTAMMFRPLSSYEDKGKSIILLLGDNPDFQREIGKIVSRKVSARKPVTKPVEAPKKLELVQMPAVSASPVAAPPREIKPREDLFNVLSVFIVTGKMNFFWARKEFAKMFRSGFQLDRNQWEIIFSSMKRTEEKGSYLLNREVDLSKFFGQAPEDLLYQYVFGDDGLMTSVLSELKEVKPNGMLPSLVAKTYLLVAALEALSLGNQDLRKVWKLFDWLEDVMGPRKLEERLRSLLQKFPKPEEKQCDPEWKGSGTMADKLQKALVS